LSCLKLAFLACSHRFISTGEYIIDAREKP
jgi:hypothetical protein